MAAEGYAQVEPELRLYYRWLGSNRQAPIVAPAATWWGHQLDRLAEGRAVLLYDSRGRGRSDPRPGDRGMLDDEIEDLERLRQQLGLERISLIGWSYLGAVVALYAARYPNQVHRLVQVGPMVPRRDPYFEQFIADYTARATALAATSRHSIWVRVIAPQLADPALAGRIVESLDLSSPHEDPEKIGKWAAQMSSRQGAWDWRPEAATVTAPVLTVHGMRDNLPIAASREWVQSFPEARLLLIDGAGHYPHFEQPDVFTASLAAFVDGGWPPGATR
jgi:pimeloyl-ACP methyl ester carboxylesterase